MASASEPGSAPVRHYDGILLHEFRWGRGRVGHCSQQPPVLQYQISSMSNVPVAVVTLVATVLELKIPSRLTQG